MVLAKPMTIGQLSRRTGVPIKALREYEQLGLIYTLGRSESNYRLFDEEALWCVQVIRTMRSLGLTLKEIQDLAADLEPSREGVIFTRRKRLSIEWDAAGNVVAPSSGAGTHIVAL